MRELADLRVVDEVGRALSEERRAVAFAPAAAEGGEDSAENGHREIAELSDDEREEVTFRTGWLA